MKLKKLSVDIQHLITPVHLINSILYSDLKVMILTGLFTEEHSYEVVKTPILYGTNTYQPTYAYTVICNDNKCRKISKEIIETFFQDTQEWREEQLEKLLTDK